MPKFSVIIPAVSEVPTIAGCLQSMEQQNCTFDFEIIVVDRTRNNITENLCRNFPHVNFVKVHSNLGIPEMRATGMAKAKGEYLAVTEDHCLVPQNWLSELAKGHETGFDIVGGAVENGSVERLVDWAVFLCEYSRFMPPLLEAGETDFVTGNNTSYSRAALDEIEPTLKKDYWEYFLLKELKRKNRKILALPKLIVIHKKEFSFFYFLAQRFYYSRSFAAMRRRESSAFQQILYLIYLPLLPFHQIWQIARNITKKKRNYKEFVLSLPILLPFMISYAAGEFAGQILGAGESLSKVE